MVCKLCPARKHCWDKGSCESCEFGKAFINIDKKIKRLEYSDIFEGYENNHDKALALISWQSAQIERLERGLKILEGMLATGEWKKSELDKKQQEMLHHLKRDLHEKAVYSRNKGIDSYIPLKVVDAIINNYLRDLEEKKHSE